jgi:two-component system sporulation sensor kinase C
VTNTGSTQDAILLEQKHRAIRQKVGILINDPANRRLMEGIVINLDLSPAFLEDADLSSERVAEFEMIIADEREARKVRPLVRTPQSTGEQIKPALVAIVPGPYTPSSQKRDSEDFDAVLALPERPALLNAQLGVALYAHRAFAQRYQSALEELNLNRNIFKSVTSGISVANAQLPDMPLMYVNPAFEVMTGYTLEEVQGRNCRFLQKDEDDQPGLTLIREALVQERETVAVLKNYRKDGALFWNELSLSPIRNRDGALTHFVGIQMDVTERVEFEIALREAEKLAAVGRLASAISHEINNPLEAVMNLVYLAQTASDAEQHDDSRRYMKQADLELQRIKLITTQSLRFYKQSHGPEAVTCDELLSSIIDIYKPRFHNFGIKVERRDRSTQHLVCLASEIRQVLSNLITNAIDAMSHRGGTLIVRTREATSWASEKKGVLITIADTGKGMSKDTLAHIYKAFYTTKGAKGTGLGLWISSEIVVRHHGHLTVRSSEKSSHPGTVFQLFLPFQAASGEGSGDRPNEGQHRSLD